MDLDGLENKKYTTKELTKIIGASTNTIVKRIYKYFPDKKDEWRILLTKDEAAHIIKNFEINNNKKNKGNSANLWTDTKKYKKIQDFFIEAGLNFSSVDKTPKYHNSEEFNALKNLGYIKRSEHETINRINNFVQKVKSEMIIYQSIKMSKKIYDNYYVVTIALKGPLKKYVYINKKGNIFKTRYSNLKKDKGSKILNKFIENPITAKHCLDLQNTVIRGTGLNNIRNRHYVGYVPNEGDRQYI